MLYGIKWQFIMPFIHINQSNSHSVILDYQIFKMIFTNAKKSKITHTLLTSCTVSIGGGGSLFRHRLTMTQVTFLKKVMGMEGLINDKRGLTTPSEMT